MHGILLIDKEKGQTSYDVVRKLKRKLNVDKIGHAGTLDPFAEGLLVVLVGHATKLSNYFMKQDKEYVGVIKFGEHFDTYDNTGTRLAKNYRVIRLEELEAVKHLFVGEIMQKPPIYSAVKVKGKKLYEYARSNIDVEIKARKVNIYSLEFAEFELYIENLFTFKTKVSSGTYIRSLAFDIASSLKTYGHLHSLNRISSGTFNVGNSHMLSDVSASDLITIDEYFKNSPQVILNDYMCHLVKNGIELDERQIETNEIFRVLNEENELIALYEPVGINKYKPLIIF